ncbi:hypothetical protein SASPL_122130 [Salvia splendens]|uniref:Complex III subunit 9 n=1 Tax=Salvia splendens TaxID=180675 RepID=A0A8X8XIT8_SALSN|nr:hypothetical protein SASPL_122130 [Salvia splendens]
MEPAVRKRGGGAWEGMYRLVMRRTPVYVTFVLVGAFVGERAVDRGIHALWEHINVGVLLLLPNFLNLNKLADCCAISSICYFRNAMRIFRFWVRDSRKSEVTTMNNLPWHPFLLRSLEDAF